MKNTKRIIAQFTFYDRSGIKELLEKQARKGWLLEKMSAFGWKFKRIEPKKIHYEVTYFPSASVFDPKPSEQQQRFWDFCEHTGWKLAGHNAQIQIFYNEDENPVPIETDPEIELWNIDNSAKKSFLPSYYLLMVVGVFNLISSYFQYKDSPVLFYARSTSLFGAVCWFILLAMCCLEVFGYFNWRKKARKAIHEDGSFTVTKGFRNVQLVLLGVVMVMFAWLLITLSPGMALVTVATVIMVACISLIVMGITNLMKRFDIPKNINRAVTIIATVVLSIVSVTAVVYMFVLNVWLNDIVFKDTEEFTFHGVKYDAEKDEIPLTVRDLTEEKITSVSSGWYGYETFLMGVHYISQNGFIGGVQQPGIDYRIIEVKAPCLYDLAFENVYADFTENRGYYTYNEHKTAVAMPEYEWSANEAYQLFFGAEPVKQYLLCYDDCMVILTADEFMTDKQKAVIGEIFS